MTYTITAPPDMDRVVLVTSDDIGPLLRDARAQRDWTVARVAHEADMSRATITLCELGDRIPHTPKLIALLDALGYDLVAVRRGTSDVDAIDAHFADVPREERDR
jgi:transcriptional regulator with XRE-family HTH domain